MFVFNFYMHSAVVPHPKCWYAVQDQCIHHTCVVFSNTAMHCFLQEPPHQSFWLQKVVDCWPDHERQATAKISHAKALVVVAEAVAYHQTSPISVRITYAHGIHILPDLSLIELNVLASGLQACLALVTDDDLHEAALASHGTNRHRCTSCIAPGKFLLGTAQTMQQYLSS